MKSTAQSKICLSASLTERSDLSHTERRIKKILEYAKRQELRSVTEKEKDFEDINEFQNHWIKARMEGPASSWKRWGGVIDEWTPWSRLGEPVNIWRYYRK